MQESTPLDACSTHGENKLDSNLLVKDSTKSFWSKICDLLFLETTATTWFGVVSTNLRSLACFQTWQCCMQIIQHVVFFFVSVYKNTKIYLKLL